MNKVGADPEVFVAFNGYIDNEPYRGILPAATIFDLADVAGYNINDDHKDYPAVSTSWGKIIVDGISLEYNPHPGNPNELVANMKMLMKETAIMLEYLNREADGVYELYIRPVVPVQLELLKEWGDPRLSMFGCDPDAIIYGERQVDPTRINAKRHPWRYFGGHAHIEWPTKENPRVFFTDPDNLFKAVYACDCTLGAASILLDQVVSQDAEKRRRVYGQPSAHRPQDWGLEYRYTTNSWLLSPERMLMFFHIAELIPLISDVIYEEFCGQEEDVRMTLISGNPDYATKLLSNVKAVITNTELSNWINEIEDVSRFNVDNWRREWIV